MKKDIFEVIKNRRSVRSFTSEKVSDDKLEKMIEMAQMAPSAGNLQSWEFIIIKKKDTREKLASVAGQKFISEPPVLIVVCANQDRSSRKYGERGSNLYSIQDSAAAIQNILLTAQSLDLSSCWIGAFDEEAVSQILNIPEGIRPVALLPVGYAKEVPNRPKRYPSNKVVHKEKW